jgi:hypothetical protein
MKAATVVTVAIAVSALGAGCGSVPAPGQPVTPGHRPALVTAAGSPTAAGNRRLAVGQARWLMSLAPVPAEATALRRPPASLSGPAMGAPEVGSLIDTSRSWRLAVPFTQALAWLRAHRPRGLPQDGSSQSWSRGQPTSAGYSYRGHSSPAWQSAELEVAVAGAGGGTSVLRADAVVVWLDPVPVPDNGPGRRVHLSVTAACPAADNSVAGVTNQGADLRRRLLPPGAPTAGLECRYYGLNGRPFRLRGQTTLTAAAASKVARAMQRLPLSHTVGGIVNCPMDDGAAEVIALSYAGRPAVDLWVKLNGCQYVANGFIEAGGVGHAAAAE